MLTSNGLIEIHYCRLVGLSHKHLRMSAKCWEEASKGIQSGGVGHTAYIGISKWLGEAYVGIENVGKRHK